MECFVCKFKLTREFKCDLCDCLCCSTTCLMEHFCTVHQHQSSGSQGIKKNIFQEKLTKNTYQAKPYIHEGTFLPNPPENLLISSLSNYTQLTSKGSLLTLGAGTFGQVYLVKDEKGAMFAIKHMNKDKLLNTLHSLVPIYNEIVLHSRLIHPHIIRLYHYKESSTSFDLVMEYANNGTLFQYIKRYGKLKEEMAFKFFIQICDAVSFMHKHNLIHRDIKPENILMVNENEVKLCDFGWCAEMTTKNRSTYCGTFEYMAPEIVNETNYDKSIDIWSLGILLYELIHGYSPFRPRKKGNAAKEVISNIKKHNLVFETQVSEDCEELIREMLEDDAKKRLKIDDVFKSRFVRRYINGSTINTLNNYSNKDSFEEHCHKIVINDNFMCQRAKSTLGIIKEAFDKKEGINRKMSFIPKRISNIIENNFREKDLEKKMQSNKELRFKDKIILKLSGKEYDNDLRYHKDNSPSISSVKTQEPENFEQQSSSISKNIVNLILSQEIDEKKEKNKIVKRFELNHNNMINRVHKKSSSEISKTQSISKDSKVENVLSDDVIPKDCLSRETKTNIGLSKRSLTINMGEQNKNFECEQTQKKDFWDKLNAFLPHTNNS